MIEFEYDGKTYKVSEDAYHDNLAIKLPDGTFVSPEYWGESKPPKPMSLKKCGPAPYVEAIVVEAA